MSLFDDTYTDPDFQTQMRDAKEQWIDESASQDPDLVVEGLRGSIVSRLLALLGVG